jgi:DNA topoisomerase-1
MSHIHYITTDDEGISRQATKKGFNYFFANNRIVKNQNILLRIKSLAIPPAYQKVWICKNAKGHIQAFGYDDQGRKQYIYHANWTASQSKKKFNHLLHFGLSLSKLRTHVSKNLNLKILTKNNSLATVIRLLDTTCIRIGSPQYTSFGLLTLRKKHVSIINKKIILDFQGKSNQQWHVEIKDKRIFIIIKAHLQELGYKLFKYRNPQKKILAINATDVNQYLQKITGREITAKEFRTWRATSYFIKLALKEQQAGLKPNLKNIISDVVKLIGNTPAVCKNSYLHPLVMKLYLQGRLKKIASIKKYRFLSYEENYLIYLLRNF